MAYTPHVLVIGGGVLGTAIARDCALRGLEVTLVEQGTLTAGTTGSIHGLLYSGARFVEENPTGAMRCLKENRTLREIAGHCIEGTDGVVLPADNDEFDEFVGACEQRSIPAAKLGRSDLDSHGIADGIDRGVEVPDGIVDPFALTRANAKSAESYGADLKIGASVVDLLRDGSDIVGVEVEFGQHSGGVAAPTSPSESVPDQTKELDTDEQAEEADAEEMETEDEDEVEDDESGMPGTVQRSFPGATKDETPEAGEREEIEADFVINAAGAWTDQIAALADIKLPLKRTRGRMVVLSGEVVEKPVVRRSDEGYPITAAPYRGNTVVGPIAESSTVTEALARVGESVPAVEQREILRSYSGVWTQHGSSSASPYGHDATLVDHEKYDDRWGMLSVIGGSVTTHRFVAEQAVDRVCSEFGIGRGCLTAELTLPDVSVESGDADPVLCETRGVSRTAVRRAIDQSEQATALANVRMATGATMGECQGGRCGHRIAAELYPENDLETVEQSLANLLERRWHGRRATLSGEQLAAALDDYELHGRVFGRDDDVPDELDTDSFDDSGYTIPEQSRADERFRDDDSTLPVVNGTPRTTDGRAKYSEAVLR